MMGKDPKKLWNSFYSRIQIWLVQIWLFKYDCIQIWLSSNMINSNMINSNMISSNMISSNMITFKYCQTGTLLKILAISQMQDALRASFHSSLLASMILILFSKRPLLFDESNFLSVLPNLFFSSIFLFHLKI